MKTPGEDEWVEIWRGTDPAPVGRLLDDAGITMRLAALGHHSVNPLGFFSFFRRRGIESRLLVREGDRARARETLRR